MANNRQCGTRKQDPMGTYGQISIKSRGYGLNRNRAIRAAFDRIIAPWMDEVQQAVYTAMPTYRSMVDKRLNLLKQALLAEVLIYDLQPKNNRGLLLESASRPMEVYDAVVMVLRHPKKLSDRLIRDFFVLGDDHAALNVYGDMLMEQSPIWHEE